MLEEEECEKCGGGRIDGEIRRVFGRRLCALCKKELPLVSQTTAMEEYLLTRSDLSLLPRIQADNPHSFMWKPMLLYSKASVEDLSSRKFPDIEAEKEQRKAKLKERKKARLKKKISALKRSTRAPVKKEAVHKHVFTQEGVCECGMSVEQEEI
ncbi:DNA-repair protein complementing XP-A cells [Nematocida sp. AWRm77]|nr:DNA-repair protein complementing XP-A cells [Nematocida sp. AWRm77]